MNNPNKKFCVGAYAASPSANGWNRENETAYYKGLVEMDFVAGLEIPFTGKLHAHDPEWFLKQLSPQWSSVITPIPGVMGVLGQDTHFGLASTDEDGRRRAIVYMREVLDAVALVNRHFDAQVITAVELHSAPTLGKDGVSSSSENFTRSLEELRSWDWQGAHLVVEHCDRFVPEWQPAKGFLSLESEIDAILASSGPTPIGMLINWGRSAIEGRSGDTPTEHLRVARDKGVLKGLIYSGCTVDSALYGNWSDSHAPFETPGSLLTRARVNACDEVASPQSLRVYGFKMQALPKSLGVEERLQFLRENAAFLRG